MTAADWTWDETLYAGSAPQYPVGRLPYPPVVADALRDALGLDGRGRLLDVGCGPGSLTVLLAALFEAAVGVDADRGMLAETARRAPGITSVWSRAEELSPDLGTFRVATFAQSFHWMDQPLVADLVRALLEPDGAWVHVGATTHQGVGDEPLLPHPTCTARNYRPSRPTCAASSTRPPTTAGSPSAPARSRCGSGDLDPHRLPEHRRCERRTDAPDLRSPLRAVRTSYNRWPRGHHTAGLASGAPAHGARKDELMRSRRAPAAALVAAVVPLLLLAWSETTAVACAVVLFVVLLAGPVLLDRRSGDAQRANRRARAWVERRPDAAEVALLARGPERLADPERAWRRLARAGLLRHRAWFSTFGLASSPVNELPTVYGGALLGSGFGLVSVVAVLVIDGLRGQSSTLAALAVVVVMIGFAGMQFVARQAAGRRLAWLDVDDPRTLAGRRALHLLASAPADVRTEYEEALAYPASWDEYRQSVIAGRRPG